MPFSHGGGGSGAQTEDTVPRFAETIRIPAQEEQPPLGAAFPTPSDPDRARECLFVLLQIHLLQAATPSYLLISLLQSLHYYHFPVMLIHELTSHVVKPELSPFNENLWILFLFYGLIP